MLLLAQSRGVWKNRVIFLLKVLLFLWNALHTVAQFPVLLIPPVVPVGWNIWVVTGQSLVLESCMMVTLFVFGVAVTVVTAALRTAPLGPSLVFGSVVRLYSFIVVRLT